jgi:lipoprotein-anchoring transpeptidase ErfK/SrfK
LVGQIWIDLSGSHRPEETAASAAFDALPAAPAPALDIGRPDHLASGRYLSRWTIVRARTVARTEPAANSQPVASLAIATPDRTPNVVDRQRLRAVLHRNGRLVFTAPVGVGSDSWPTPGGKFIIRSELTRYASPFYGPIAFGTSARSAVLTDWPGGGFIGIHGTSEPQLIPGRVSHGCIRMRNSDILRLAKLMPVGTPVTIR